ncbi:MAG: YifB family Mg chelatase-like AAA ATPase [Angustibacter sp.]
MALGFTRAVALTGLAGHLVDVEADVAGGLPAFTITGLPDAALGEARDRVRAACANSGVPLPPRRITVNLSPASLPKTGTAFDLALAVAVLMAAEVVPGSLACGVVHVGELGLDGRVRGVRGVLPVVLAAVRAGVERVVVPAENLQEARLVPDVEITGVRTIAELVADYRAEPSPVAPTFLPAADPVGSGVPTADGRIHLRHSAGDSRNAVSPISQGAPEPPAEVSVTDADLLQVLGQTEARLAVEVAAAGGHHLLLLGPPGAGKTMLAARLPGLLPDLPVPEALEVTAIHSLCGMLPAGGGLVVRPPFVDPHHTATAAAIVGGGARLARPGAVSRAHHGVLFLDEAPEFDPRVLDALRQPLEVGEVVLHRAAGVARYPARFQLVLAANPCPCGRSVGHGTGCTCTPMARRRYLQRLSGPMLDRIDLQMHMLPVGRAALADSRAPEPSAVVAGRVAQARHAQAERWAATPWRLNAHVPGHVLRRGSWARPAAVTRCLDRAVERGTLTVRGYDRVLRAAWTLADLAGRAGPAQCEVEQAFTMRHHERAAA